MADIYQTTPQETQQQQQPTQVYGELLANQVGAVSANLRCPTPDVEDSYITTAHLISDLLADGNTAEQARLILGLQELADVYSLAFMGLLYEARHQRDYPFAATPWPIDLQPVANLLQIKPGELPAIEWLFFHEPVNISIQLFIGVRHQKHPLSHDNRIVRATYYTVRCAVDALVKALSEPGLMSSSLAPLVRTFLERTMPLIEDGDAQQQPVASDTLKVMNKIQQVLLKDLAWDFTPSEYGAYGGKGFKSPPERLAMLYTFQFGVSLFFDER